MSCLHFVSQLLRECRRETAILVSGSCSRELGKGHDTGKLICGLTTPRGQNWLTLDKEGRNKIIYSCCSQGTKEPVFQVPNPAPNT